MILEHFILKSAIVSIATNLLWSFQKIVMKIMDFNLSGAFKIILKWNSFFQCCVFFHIKWWLQVQIMFIFYCHVVQYYTSHKDVSYDFLVPLFTRVCYFKTLFHILMCSFLRFGKMLSFFTMGFMDGLHKYKLTRISSIDQQIVMKIFFAIDFKNQVYVYTSQKIRN